MSATVAVVPPRPRAVARGLFRRRTVLIGAVLIAAIAMLALLAPEIAPYSPTRLSIANRLHPPSARWWFGTDDFGRDVFSRVLYGGRLSLLVGASVVAVSTIAGTVLGLAAGYFRRLDAPIGRLLDAMMAFPDILLAISLVAALGASVANVIVALSVVYTPRLARIVRAATLVIRELTYVEAARATGLTTVGIIARHVLRGLVSPVLVQGSFVFAYAMLTEAGLSFLGVGVSPETPTWGTMIAAGKGYLDQAPWIMLFPGVTIVVAVLSLQLIGDGLRDLLDPRLGREI
ncbi:MAG TPA: ABC transporter permease [Acetobacteraceae bacterium]|nr:ABC transporter permease [Acetobacteraceae bacterium]